VAAPVDPDERHVGLQRPDEGYEAVGIGDVVDPVGTGHHPEGRQGGLRTRRQCPQHAERAVGVAQPLVPGERIDPLRQLAEAQRGEVAAEHRDRAVRR